MTCNLGDLGETDGNRRKATAGPQGSELLEASRSVPMALQVFTPFYRVHPDSGFTLEVIR